MSVATVAIEVAVNAPGGRAALGRARVESLVRLVCAGERVRRGRFTVTWLAPRAMARLNREHLGHTGATDIITFELRDPSGAPEGDIYICPAVARENARAWGVPVREEYARLVIHGVLHAIGHVHPDGAARLASPMWRAQERYVARARESA